MVSLLLNQIFENMIVKCNMLNSDNKVKRHPLSFLVEAADSISYNIMDIEDGLTMGWYSFSYIIKYLDKYLQEKTSNQDYSILAELGIDFKQK